MTAQKARGWSRSEVDHLLSDQQDDLVRVGQQSLKKRFEGLTDELLIDEVYALSLIHISEPTRQAVHLSAAY